MRATTLLCGGLALALTAPAQARPISWLQRVEQMTANALARIAHAGAGAHHSNPPPKTGGVSRIAFHNPAVSRASRFDVA
jgi:hypothetical protein